jgi:hypothetical protein
VISSAFARSLSTHNACSASVGVRPTQRPFQGEEYLRRRPPGCSELLTVELEPEGGDDMEVRANGRVGTKQNAPDSV